MTEVTGFSRRSAAPARRTPTSARLRGRVRARMIAVLIAAGIGAVLGYGYWHQHTHATFGLALRDGTVTNRWQPIAQAQLKLIDATGRERAQAEARPGGAVVLTQPREFSCAGLEFRGDRSEWRQCFARQSRWLATWVTTLRHVDVAVGNCRLRAPVTPSITRDEWWLWWVPLPHVGGRPYQNVSVTLAVDPGDCSAVAPR